jgi:hypothetical protein
MNFLQQEMVDTQSSAPSRRIAEELLEKLKDVKMHLAFRAMYDIAQNLYSLSLTLQGRGISMEAALKAVEVRRLLWNFQLKGILQR